MNIRKFVFVMVLALGMALIVATAVIQGALAQCVQGRDCPDDEREKKATVTDVPSPTPTDTPTPVPPPAACLPPDEDQLAVWCAGLIPPPADPALPLPGTGDGELTDPGTPDPGPPDGWPLILIGGGLFLGGMVIGRLLPAVSPFSWGRAPGGAAHPPEPGFESLKQKVSPFHKTEDGGEDVFGKHLPAQEVFPKVESDPGYMKLGEGASEMGFPKVESQDSFAKFGDEGSQKVFPKVESEDSFAKFADEGSQKVFPKVEGQSDFAKMTGESSQKVTPGDEAADLGEAGMDTSGLKQ